MIPRDRLNEFFGFNSFAGKISAVLGPLAFGVVTTLTGSRRMGLVSLLVFFALGGLVLLFVKIPASGKQLDDSPSRNL